MQKKKLMIIDIPLVNTFLSSNLLKECTNFEIVATTSDENDALGKIKWKNPDYILFDPSLKSFNVSDFINKIRSIIKHAKIIFFSSQTLDKKLEEYGEWVYKPLNLLTLNNTFGIGKQIVNIIHSKIDANNETREKSITSVKTVSKTGTGKKLKVMVVDDAAIMKVVIKNILLTDPELEIVGYASNGKEALERMEEVTPDIILLDIEMPVMDGLEFLRQARLRGKSKIIVISSVTPKGSPKASQALRLGASVVLTKPSGAVSIDLANKSGKLILDTIHNIAYS